MMIGTRLIGAFTKPLIIAEIGINHGGDLTLAQEMIYAAHSCGVECVKFQFTIPEEDMILTPSNKLNWEVMKNANLTIDEHSSLKSFTESLGMIYLCTPFSRKAANYLNELGVLAFKVASSDCTNIPFIRYLKQFNKPLIVSTGMTANFMPTIHELKNTPFALLHCNATYPTKDTDSRLARIATLQNVSRVPVGFSDHSLHNRFALASVALGASIIEKHFTIDKSLPFPDNSISIGPDEMKELVTYSKLIHTSCTSTFSGVLDDEKPIAAIAKQSFVSTCDINKGELLTIENVWPKRPGNGEIPPMMYGKVFNKRAAKNIPKNTQLKWEDIY